MPTNWTRLLFPESTTEPATPAPTDRWAQGLDPALVTRVRQLQDMAAREGIPVQIKEGYRSPERQAELYAQGRTKPGDIVTYARPGKSRHQSARAVDLVPLRDGQPDEASPHWQRLGDLGKSLGLRWGGDFKRLKDKFHFELPGAPPGARAQVPQAAAVEAKAPTRDWQFLFASEPSAPPERSTIVQRIHQEARRQGVDPKLAEAVATQESSLNPAAVGDRGKSLGLFQLQRAAAIDAGIDPKRRGEVDQNIRGGVGYLKRQLDREGGNVERALSRYNRGTPDYRGIGDPHYVENVMSHYQRQPLPGLLQRLSTAAGPAPPPRDWGQILGFEATEPQAGSPAAVAVAAPALDVATALPGGYSGHVL